MTQQDEGFVALPAYAARATSIHKVVLETVNNENRSEIVYSAQGPQNVPMHFRSDGIVIFDFPKSDTYSGGGVEPYIISDGGEIPKDALLKIKHRDFIRERRYLYMNAFSTCFNVAIEMSNDPPFPVCYSRYISASFDNNSWTLKDNGSTSLHQIPFALRIDQKCLEDALENFNNIDINKLDISLKVLDLFYRSAFHMNNHEFQTTLILGWAIIEACQDELWGEFLKNGYKKVNPNSEISGSRRKKLLGDRNYTAAVKSQILSLVGQYADHDLERVDRVRKKRNDFMHELKPATMDDGFEAMWACQLVIDKALGLKVRPFGNPSSFDFKR